MIEFNGKEYGISDFDLESVTFTHDGDTSAEELAAFRDALQTMGSTLRISLVPDPKRMKSAELWPEGRTLFYEGNDPEGFVADMKAKYGLKPTVTIDCPAELLDEIQRAHNMGS